MKWLVKLKKYAPDIAAAVASGGATLPALALKAISEATGVPLTNQDDLEKHIIGASPSDLLKLKQADNQFKLEKARIKQELEIVEIGDAQHARDAHKDSIMPCVVLVISSALVTGCLVSLFVSAIPSENNSILYGLIGQITGIWVTSVGYFTGTTRSSTVKTWLMSKPPLIAGDNTKTQKRVR